MEGLRVTEQVRFAPTRLGQSSLAAVTVTNLADAPLRLSELTLTPSMSWAQELEQAQPWPSEITLARDETLVLRVRWQPMDLIEDSAVVSMRTNRADYATLSATLRTPTLAGVKLAPAPIIFNASQRRPSEARLVSVESVGERALLVRNVRVVGDSGEVFSLSFPDGEAPDDPRRDATHLEAQRLEPGERLLVRVAAAPGEALTIAALHVEADGADIAAHYASLEARGPSSASAPLLPADDVRRTCLRLEGAQQLAHTRWAIDFGLVPAYVQSRRVVTLVSCGSDPITLRSLERSGSLAFSVSGLPVAPTLTLAPGERREVEVVYQAESGAPEHATLRWLLADQPHTLDLTGTLKRP